MKMAKRAGMQNAQLILGEKGKLHVGLLDAASRQSSPQNCGAPCSCSQHCLGRKDESGTRYSSHGRNPSRKSLSGELNLSCLYSQVGKNR